MTNTSPRSSLFIVLALVCLVAVSIFPLSLRVRAESYNRAVTISAEYDAIETLAAGSGVPNDKAFSTLRQSGLNAVVIGDETVGELINSGQITVKTISVADAATRTRVEVPALVLTDPAVLARVQKGILARFGDRAGRLDVRNNVLSLPDVPISLIRGVSVGLPPEQVRVAKEHELLIIARSGNPPAATENYIKSTLADIKASGAKYFLPSGDQVLGNRLAIRTTAESLKQLELTYVTAEFGKMSGDLATIVAEPTNVVRLHTAQLAELEKMTVDEAVDRYEKAARERNIRILLLRPITGSAPSPLTEFSNFVDRVAAKVRLDHATIAPAHGYEDLKPGAWFPILQSLAAAILFAAFFTHIRPAVWPKKRYSVWVGVGVLAVTLMGASTRGRDIVILSVSVLAPIAGFFLADWIVARLRERRQSAIVAAGAGALACSLASFAGGIFVAGTQVGVEYLIKLDEFSGIKVAVFLPIVLVGAYFLYKLTNLKATLATAITWGSVLLGVTLVAALAVLISRTGNDGVGASGLEMSFRGLLDKYLFVRPRTKEFLIGHPGLWIGLAMLAKYRQDRRFHGWIALMLAVGAVGQTGIVNTLCHGHIPFMLSVARIWLGFAIGSLLGAGLWLLVRLVLPKPATSG